MNKIKGFADFTHLRSRYLFTEIPHKSLKVVMMHRYKGFQQYFVLGEGQIFCTKILGSQILRTFPTAPVQILDPHMPSPGDSRVTEEAPMSWVNGSYIYYVSFIFENHYTNALFTLLSR